MGWDLDRDCNCFYLSILFSLMILFLLTFRGNGRSDG
jgi:hypothetical protein